MINLAGRKVRLGLLGIAAAALTLAGCGVAPSGVGNASTAVSVGDDTYDNDQVDALSDELCGVVEETGAVLPLRDVRAFLVHSLVVQGAVQQAGQDNDIDTRLPYDPKKLGTDEGAIDEDLRSVLSDAQVEFETTLQELGSKGAEPGLPPEQQAARAGEIVQAWLDDHRPEFNPRLGLAYDSDFESPTWPLTYDQQSGSVAVSDDAKLAGGSLEDAFGVLQGQPLQQSQWEYLQTLPEDEVCGKVPAMSPVTQAQLQPNGREVPTP